ncbi:MAG: hypothetical protein Q9181_006966 [Wetmoreana brouardii]
MAEVLGLVAGIFTLSQAVAEGINHVIEFYKAPAEIMALQDIQCFRDVLLAVEASAGASAQNVLYGALFRAKRQLAELNQLITVKLIKQGNGPGRVRRRAWLRNKRKIVRFQEKLKMAKEILLGILNAELLLGLPTYSDAEIYRLIRHNSSSMRRIESALTTIHEQSIESYSTTPDLNRHLQERVDTLVTQQSLQASTLMTSSTAHLLSACPVAGEDAHRMPRPSVVTSSYLLGVSSFPSGHVPTDNEKNLCGGLVRHKESEPFRNSIRALFVPFGINWGHGKLLALFSGFNAIAFILTGNNTLQVWFFVPSTNYTATLEDMSYVFGRKLGEHALAQAKRLWPTSKVRGPRIEWLTASREGRTTSQATQNKTVQDEPTGQADDSIGTSSKTPALTTEMAQTSKSDDEITEVAK